jgi:hypothetical protein
VACFIVKGRSGQALGYFHFEEEPGRRAAANLLHATKRGGLWPNIAKLPALLCKPPPLP